MRRILFPMTASVFFAVTVISCVAAATDERTSAAAIDPAFESGLASLKKATGIIEGAADRSQSHWQPNLQLLLGLKATRGSKQTVSFVELTTVRPPLTNAAGQPWTPRRETNRFDWSGTNTSSKRTLEFFSSLYPVRVRVFDASGRKVKEGEVTLPWELLTNSLVEACRLSLPSAPGAKASVPLDNPEAARPLFGGMISLVTLLARIRSIRAKHPSKPHQELMAQVLATGLAREEAVEGTSPLR
jgi:hypothetical protein